MGVTNKTKSYKGGISSRNEHRPPASKPAETHKSSPMHGGSKNEHVPPAARPTMLGRAGGKR